MEEKSRFFGRFFISILLIIFTVSVLGFAEDIDSKLYVIRDGDTLWDISGAKLGDNYKWPLIWKQNSYINDPDLIFPGNELYIPNIAENETPEPEVVAAPEESSSGGEKEFVSETTEEEAPMSSTEMMDDVFFSDEGSGPPPENWPEVYCPEAKTRDVVRELEESFMVPAEVVLSAGYIKDEEDFVSSGYILGDVLIRRKQYDCPGDEVVLSFTRNTPGIHLGDSMLIYRWGNRVNDKGGPKNYLGKLVEVVGILIVNEVGEESSKGTIIKAFGAVKKGDLLRPYSPEMPVNDFNYSSPREHKGYIVETKHGVIWPSQPQNIVYIDLGRMHGVSIGNIFDVYRLMEEIKEPKSKQKRYVYKEYIGKILVINLEEDSATCAVLESIDIFEKGNYVLFTTEL